MGAKLFEIQRFNEKKGLKTKTLIRFELGDLQGFSEGEVREMRQISFQIEGKSGQAILKECDEVAA